MSDHPILQIKPLGFPWETIDPFLFCAYHDDAYPQGNAQMGPAASLAGRQMGSDFSCKDGWSMYHGQTVPGFPAHPHRGFETVTIVRKGLIDHSDSLGATARFGAIEHSPDSVGDVQWLTAGKGIVHCEMFPLLRSAEPNPLELFQIWLNLPAKSKMVEPHFTMLWSQNIPRLKVTDAQGHTTDVAVVAGDLQGAGAPPPSPPDSWAAQADADVAIWTIRMDAGARWTLPAAKGARTRRMLYAFKGSAVTVGGQAVSGVSAVELLASTDVALVNNGHVQAEFLLLQGRPIAEPVAQHGPFAMNTQAEIAQTIADYRRTKFGGWPWGASDPVHGREPARFAKHPNGREEWPEKRPEERLEAQA